MNRLVATLVAVVALAGTLFGYAPARALDSLDDVGSSSKVEAPPDVAFVQIGGTFLVLGLSPGTGWIKESAVYEGYDEYQLFRSEAGGRWLLIARWEKSLGQVHYTDDDFGSNLNLSTQYCYQLDVYEGFAKASSRVACATTRAYPPGFQHARIRILTHNVFGQPEDECAKRMASFGENVAQAEPAYDIVAVQEYFRTTDGDLRSCDSKHLMDAITGPPEYQYRNSDEQYLFKPEGEVKQLQWDGGIGIFARHSIVEQAQWEWTDDPGWEWDGLLPDPPQLRVQGFTFTRISIQNTPAALDVYVVHPHSDGEGCDQACHDGNMQQVADRIGERSANGGNPVLVMGDFNIEADPEGNPRYAAIMAALRNPRDLWKAAHPAADPREGYTKDGCPAITWSTCTGEGFPSGAPANGARIDYIFVVDDRSLTNSPYEIVVANPDDVRVVKWYDVRYEYPFYRRVSDHFGVEAIIEIRERGKPQEREVVSDATASNAAAETPTGSQTSPTPVRDPGTVRGTGSVPTSSR